MSTETSPAIGEYTEAHMKSLKDAAHIRQNPGMYVGNTQSSGLHHLVYEIVYNSVDECPRRDTANTSASPCTSTAPCSVADDGRGIPVGHQAGHRQVHARRGAHHRRHQRQV